MEKISDLERRKSIQGENAASSVLNSTLKELRKKIILAAAASKEGHIPSAFSVLEILWVLYDRVLNIRPEFPDAPDRDRFILSKGHSSLGHYAVLSEKKFFPSSWLDTFGSYSSPLGGHADSSKVPGVEASTGSLGHGLAIATGIALGLKIQNKSARVVCLVGDGECNEGSIWEAALLASHHQLSNLCCIVDYNHSTDRALGLGKIHEKFAAFGFETEVIDGHDMLAIENAITLRPFDKPIAIVAETTKGYGCTLMENNPSWHHRSPASTSEIEELLGSLR